MKTVLGLLSFAALLFGAGYALPENEPTQNLQAAVAPKPDSTAGKQAKPVGLQHKMKTFRADSAEGILQFAEQFMGLGYKYGGNTPTGFDCSGFTHYVFSQFGYNVPHGSRNQAEIGDAVHDNEIKKGDLLIFTGTNLADRTPGHVGIVTSESGPIQFIHSSSNGGVKISEVHGTRYAARLLEVRRIL